MSTGEKTGPLRGIRALDFTLFQAGGLATTILADLGGEVVFCLGMSEPNAGSDLAALRTRAVEDGDFFVVDGQKVWTTFAHEAEGGVCRILLSKDPRRAAPEHYRIVGPEPPQTRLEERRIS